MARFRLRGQPGAQPRGNPRGHPYERAARGEGIVPSRPEALVGSISESAFQRLLGPNMHAPALDNQTTVAGVHSALPNGLPGAGFVAEASRLSVNALDFNVQIGQVPGGAFDRSSMVFGGRQETVYVVTQRESEEADAHLHHNLDIMKERRQKYQLQLDLNEISDGSIKEPGLELQLQQLSLNQINDENMKERRLELDLNVEISNEDDTTTWLSQERGESSNAADLRLEDTAWKEAIILLIKEHEDVVSQMKKAHEESQAELVEHHDKIVTEVYNSYAEQYELFKSQMWRIVAVDRYETEKQVSFMYHKELKATKKVKVVALKTLAEFVLTMSAQQAALKSQLASKEMELEEAQGAMHAQVRLLQLHVHAMEATAAAMSKAIQRILAMQVYHKIQLQAAVVKVADYDPDGEQAEQRASELLLEFAMKVLNPPEDDTVASSKRNFSTSTRPEALFSPRLEINVNTMMDSETAALDEGQTVQDDAAKVDGPEHLVDTTMEPASEITQAPPTDIPHDIVNVECRSNDLENGGTEEQLQKKRKRESVNSLTGEPEEESHRKRLPRKSVKPARHMAEDQEVTRVFPTEEGTLDCI